MTPNIDVKIDGTSLKYVKNFKYVGSTENSNGTMSDEIKIRVQRMAMSFNKLSRRLFFNKNISLKVKLMMFEVFILSVGLYGCATWNTSAEDIRQLEVWQQRAIRKILNIKWFDRVSFFDIVNIAAHYNYNIVPIEFRIRQSRLKYFGHVNRMNDDRLPKILLHAECDYGQRLVGQPEINYRNCIKKDLFLFGIKEWKESVHDRKVWRASIFHGREIFLKHWWTVWVKKYHLRHGKKSLHKESIGEDVLRGKVDFILRHESNISTERVILVPLLYTPSVLQKILAINDCLDDMLSEIEKRIRLDMLCDRDSILSTGSRNILISDSILNRSHSRTKHRKYSVGQL